jgi:hypothetical protein
MTSRTGRWLAALCSATVLAGCTTSTPQARPVRTSAIPVAPTPRSPADARYVSLDGDDHGPGSADRPWRTLSASLPKLSAGQVLYVHGGVYREVLTKLALHHGRRGRPIGVTNVPGETPVIKGSVLLRRPDHWRINGIDVTWDGALAPPPRFLVTVVGGVAWRWTNSEIYGSRGAANMFVAGFGPSEPRGWLLSGDCFHGPPSGRGAAPASNLMLGNMVDPGRGVIRRDVIYAEGNEVDLAIGSAHAAPRNVQIRHNTIYGGRLAIAVRGGPRNVRITRNVLGGASSDVLVQFDLKPAPGTMLRQNYGIVSPAGAPGAGRLARPEAEALIGGPGNVLSDRDPHFPDPRSCAGFHSRVAALAPYGRYGL